MIVQMDKKPRGIILDSVVLQVQQDQHEQALKAAENLGGSPSFSPQAALDDTAGTATEVSSANGDTFPSRQEKGNSRIQKYTTGDLNGRVCEVSISHDGEYAVATALVFDEDFDPEKKMMFPLYD
jgi:hypothetical protein